MSSLNGFIDLHSHTNLSDGTLSPEELVNLAKSLGLDALAITDHDTFAGYEAAVPFALDAGLDLVRGIELNTKLRMPGTRTRNLHLLAYFPVASPGQAFVDWLNHEQTDRRNRNRKLIKALRSRGLDIDLSEVEAVGRSLTGRPHFARVLMQKGYAHDHEDAFRRYLGESAPTYVERESQSTEDAIEMVRSNGGIPVVAHPIRLSLSPAVERDALRHLRSVGLLGLEIYHSEHPPEQQARYGELARELDLLPTGGSDFHGSAKPGVELGTGTGNNIRVPREILEALRQGSRTIA